MLKLVMCTQIQVGGFVDRSEKEIRIGMSRSKATGDDRQLQGMRSKGSKQRRNKGKASEIASYQKQHLLFPGKGSAAFPQNQLEWQEKEDTAHNKERKMALKHFAKIKRYIKSK